MEHGADHDAGLVHLAHDAVDQEGPVVLDHFQSLQLQAKVEIHQPHMRTVAVPLGGEAPEVGGRGREVRG